ncbi:MAG: hypothetical protein BGN85_01925 [Alphaproteobacteria bacterium 64-11]|nr:outer membrane beta-barrel protein [Alphaproteobacteria bacterium]OJU12344.1 MAG: hypothetical protein BGN85_01925 [Alphaproteobacteria bacterium 64-11]
MPQVPANNPERARRESGALLEGMGVMDRARPEYDAQGLPVGGLTLFPTLAAAGTLDDNIYRAADPTVDSLWTISPRLDLRSNWLNNAFQLYSQLDHYAYDSHDTETRTDWIVGGLGRLDLAPGSYAMVRSSYFDTHESRTSPDLSLTALSPTRYTRGHADGTLVGQFSAFTLTGMLSYDRYDFDSTKLIGGGFIDNGDRNRNALEATGRVSYELAPEQAVFVQMTYDRRDFDRQVDRNGFDRNSDGTRVDAGVSMMMTPLIRGTAYVGWLQQNYAAPLKDANGIDFNAQIDWFATELLTAHLTASRIIDDTTIAGASSVEVSRVGASADYELLRPLILQPYVRYTDENFQGITRDDQISEAGLEARYLMNNYLAAYVGFDFQNRATTATGRDFTDHVFTLGIRGQY